MLNYTSRCCCYTKLLQVKELLQREMAAVEQLLQQELQRLQHFLAQVLLVYEALSY